MIMSFTGLQKKKKEMISNFPQSVYLFWMIYCRKTLYGRKYWEKNNENLR